MALENIKIQIEMLLDEIQDHPGTWHTVYQNVMTEIGAMCAVG